MSDTPEVDQSTSIAALAAALAKAQGAMHSAKKDSVNPHFKSSYADLAAIWDACREPLAANGLAVMQRVTTSTDGVCITTQLVHASGEWVRDRCVYPVAQRTSQGIGSAITYGRRYSLAALLGIAAEEDDDGNAASTGAARRAPQEASARTTRVNDVKEKIKASLMGGHSIAASANDVAAASAELKAEGKKESTELEGQLTESVQAMAKIQAMSAHYGFSGQKMASVIKGATGKSNRLQVTLDDVEKIKAAIEVMISTGAH